MKNDAKTLKKAKIKAIMENASKIAPNESTESLELRVFKGGLG